MDKWKVTDRETQDITITNDDWRVIARIPRKKDVDTANREARLIALAPSLYATLNTALQLISIKYGNLDPSVTKFVEDARAMMAKVESE